MNKMEKMFTLEEEEKGNMPKEFMRTVTPKSAALRFRLLYFNDDNQKIHKVEVRNINFQDLTRHLKRGESVCITPEFLGNSSKHTKEQKDWTPWYFTHI